MIRTNFQDNYQYDPQRTFDFSKYIPNGVSLYYGLGQQNTNGDRNKKVKFYVETPNFLYGRYDSGHDNENYDLVLHLCPYTCNYLNDKHTTDKFKPIFFPLEDIRIENERTIDVYYTGHSIWNLNVCTMIENFVRNKLGEHTFLELKNRMSKESIDSYYAKMDILSRTKICIAHNVLVPRQHIPDYFSNFLTRRHLPWDEKDTPIPQIKSRIFEGALMGCVLLVYKDEYNVIERYFTEGDDFIYFTDEEDLRNKTETILADYSKYVHIGLNAQKRVRENYLTKHFIDEMLKLL